MKVMSVTAFCLTIELTVDGVMRRTIAGVPCRVQPQLAILW